MGNFKPYSTRQAQRRHQRKSNRAVLQASVGLDAENLPSDLRVISTALAEADLLSPDTPSHMLKSEILRAIRHVRRTITDTDLTDHPLDKALPSGMTEHAVRRAFAEMRFSTFHRKIAETTAPKGAREVIALGVALARHKTPADDTNREMPNPHRRALLPPITPTAFQSNRRLVEALTQTDIQSIDFLIAESIRLNGKVGFVEVRDFFVALMSRAPHKSKRLAENVKRRLCGKSRRRFIKLQGGIAPSESDFND